MTRLPDVDELFSTEHMDRWPMGIFRVELDDGHPVFYGPFAEVDAETARRAFRRPVTLEPWADGTAANLVVHASSCGPETCSMWPGVRMPSSEGAQQWADALNLDMARTGRSFAQMIQFGRIHGHLCGVTLDHDSRNADEEKGIVASHGGWVVGYDSSVDAWTVR